jgi:hypothetical protein
VSTAGASSAPSQPRLRSCSGTANAKSTQSYRAKSTFSGGNADAVHEGKYAIMSGLVDGAGGAGADVGAGEAEGLAASASEPGVREVKIGWVVMACAGGMKNMGWLPSSGPAVDVA